MTKLPCAVVRDLLPTYAENLTEPETKELVALHLQDCADCRARLEELSADPPHPLETAQPLDALKRQIRVRRLRSAAMAALCVFLVLFIIFFHVDSRQPIPWQEGLLSFKCLVEEEGEEPYLLFSADSRLAGSMTKLETEEDGSTTWYVQGIGNDLRRWGLASDETSELALAPVPDRVIYGYSGEQQLLWARDPETEARRTGGTQILPRLALAYYLLMATAALAVTGILWLALRHKKSGAVMRRIFLVPLSYLLAHLLLKGLRTVSFSLPEDLIAILLVAATLWSLFNLGWESWAGRGRAQSPSSRTKA